MYSLIYRSPKAKDSYLLYEVSLLNFASEKKEDASPPAGNIAASIPARRGEEGETRKNAFVGIYAILPYTTLP